MRPTNLRLKVAALLAFTAVCLLTFLYLFNQAGGRIRLGDPYHVYALVPDSLNIVPNSDVRADGITIGRVQNVEPAGRLSKIRFELEKQGEQRLYKDATVWVRTKTLVGESYLDVDPGRPSAGKVPSGATLPLAAAQETVPLERILNMLDPATRRQVRRNLHGVGVGLEGRGDKLNEMFGALQPAVENSGELMRILRPQRVALAALIDNSGRVLDAFGQRTSALRTLAIDAKATAEAVASRDEQLRQALRELPPTLQQAQTTVAKLGDFSSRATPVFAELRGAAHDLAPTLRELEPAARRARALFRELRPFLTAADPLFRQLTPASEQLRTVIPPLDALMRELAPTAAYLRPYSKEAGTFFGNVGALVSATDAYGQKGRVFGMVGPNQYTNFTPEQQKLADALLSAGFLQQVYQSQSNPYPKAGSLTDLKPFDGDYPHVGPKK
ncbi:MAG: phospholipid/cholesterol/gamma-HCH transport system substrate-binding protein [Solirubrobacteraceae bacterium]|nr:phospholipid/cholesterol/gamma-HCH transport system substrate-binding protein [Solirubrobacteraceae bacterium]